MSCARPMSPSLMGCASSLNGTRFQTAFQHSIQGSPSPLPCQLVGYGLFPHLSSSTHFLYKLLAGAAAGHWPFWDERAHSSLSRESTPSQGVITANQPPFPLRTTLPKVIGRMVHPVDVSHANQFEKRGRPAYRGPPPCAACVIGAGKLQKGYATQWIRRF